VRQRQLAAPEWPELVDELGGLHDVRLWLAETDSTARRNHYQIVVDYRPGGETCVTRPELDAIEVRGIVPDVLRPRVFAEIRSRWIGHRKNRPRSGATFESRRFVKSQRSSRRA
jgi:hypothetical protein